ncbi:hypothetical protein HAX54_004488, partial [Datura stramonium]|nr:hypothetical protein [Datura stramonium]
KGNFISIETKEDSASQPDCYTFRRIRILRLMADGQRTPEAQAHKALDNSSVDHWCDLENCRSSSKNMGTMGFDVLPIPVRQIAHNTRRLTLQLGLDTSGPCYISGSRIMTGGMLIAAKQLSLA